jgi:hypothetical protein
MLNNRGKCVSDIALDDQIKDVLTYLLEQIFGAQNKDIELKI